MIIAILKELNDSRVAIIPVQTKIYIEHGHHFWVEKGAGELAYYPDKEYESTGAIIKSREEILSSTEMIITIQPLPSDEVDKMKNEAVYISIFQPFFDSEILQPIAKKNILAFSLDMIPRTTMAQSMDVISSMASIAGYNAVLQAANLLPKYFPMFITAAGSNPPAKVLVLGAGIAGLQAIATAKRLGAVVNAFDTRAASKEEVESLGAKFIMVEGSSDDTTAGGYAVEQTEEFKQKQRELIHDNITKADVVITTAQLRGKKAPILVTSAMLEAMQPGSVVVDMAASTGGNCEETVNNKTIVYKDINIIGDSNLASQLPTIASKLFSKNIENYISIMFEEDKFAPDFENNIISSSCVVQNGEIVYENN